MSQNVAEIAKEITIAAIEKGVVVLPGKGSYENLEDIQTHNQLRANEIAKLYKVISKSVNQAIQGDFSNE